MTLDVFMACTTELREGWKNFMPAPVVPKSYRGKATEAKWLDEKWDQLQDEAADRPVTGRIKQMTLLTNVVDSAIDGDGAHVYCELNRYIAAQHPAVVRIWGMQPRTFMHMAAVDATMQGKSTQMWGMFADTHTSRPAELASIQMLDPVKLLLGSSGTPEHVSIVAQLVKEVTEIPEGFLSEAGLMRDLVYTFGMHKALLA